MIKIAIVDDEEQTREQILSMKNRQENKFSEL